MEKQAVARIIHRYRNLEEDLSEFLKYLPPQGKNLNAWSPRLATVIKESCALFESFLKRVSPPKVKIGGIRKERDELNIQDLARVYSKKLSLADRKVILLATFPPEYRNPFENWKSLPKQTKDIKSPNWWTIHNNLKHGEIDNFQEATLGTAIDSLAGILMTLGAAPEMTRGLMHADFLHWIYVPPSNVVNWALGGFVNKTPVILKTSLFAVILGGYPLPEDINDFRPMRHTHSRLLVPYFEKF